LRPANLARRPFRNERLPNLLFAAAALALAALTVRHAFVVRALLPGRTSALHDEVMRLEEEATRLRAEQVSLRGIAPDPKALARWLVVKDLVDRRAFSWTTLFARLEERLPDGARLVSIAPTLQHGDIMLDVQAVVRSPEVGWQFMRTLEEGGDFDDVFPLTESQGGEFHYKMRYRPRSTPAVADAPEGGAPAADSASPSSDPSPPSLPDGGRAGVAPSGRVPEARP
jgi:Tfp pilus assembly protein PilN